jgi:TonB-linked SusC/RagA family outer membrane protein
MFIGLQGLLAQSREISGVVTSAEDGLSIPGVSVIVKGTTIGTSTDFDGKYTINVPEGENILVFSFVGMTPQELAVTGTTMNVVMEAESIGMDEVIVVAYGTAKKGSMVGSAAQIGSNEISLRPISNVSNAVEGMTPGVQVASSSGQPGAGPSIRIRGIGSYGASNAPLYVVDQVPFTGSINTINPSDIESLTILKDAGSTALYGNKAANGVVLITTKSGKKGKGQFSFNASSGIVSRAQKEYSRLNPFEYYPIMWEAYRNGEYSGTDPDELAAANLKATNEIYDELMSNPFDVANNAIVGVDGKINPNAKLLYGDDLDWEDAITRTGKRQNYDLSYGGATDKADYYVSMGYLKEEGYVIQSDFERYTGRARVNLQVNDRIKTGFNLNGALTKGNLAQAKSGQNSSFVNPFGFSRKMGPIYPIHQHNADGSYVLDDNGNKIYDVTTTRPTDANNGRHIVAETKWNKDKEEITTLGAKAYVDVNIIEGLKFTANASIDQRNYYNTVYWNDKVGDGAPGGYLFKQYTKRTGVNLNQLLNYTKTLNEVHNFNVLLGHESYKLKIDDFNGDKNGQILDGNHELINFVTINSLESSQDQYTTEGYFGRLNYDYDGKYLLSASFRRDGTSRFAKNRRWGNFWSAGIGWRIDRESFVENLTWINMLKFRASIGGVGNDRTTDSDGYQDYYIYQQLASLGKNNGSEPGTILDKLGAPNLEWESNISSDVALEFALFDKLSGSIEYFHRKSKNLLFSVPTPMSTGFESTKQNIGTMVNYGLEFGISYTPIDNDLRWTISTDVTTYKNEMKKLPQDEIISGSKKLSVGHSRYDYWLRDWYGVDPTDGSGLFVAEDATKPGVRILNQGTANEIAVTPDHNNAKYHYSGSAIPDFFGSLNNTFSYKNFDLSIMMTYSVGGKVLDYNYQDLMSSGTYGQALHRDILKRWQKPGDITDVPRMDPVNNSSFDARSDRWLVDASYVNLRQVNLAYNFPSEMIKDLGLSQLRLYVSGENLWLKNKRKGLQSQEAFDGTTSNAYTPNRVFTVGVNVKF